MHVKEAIEAISKPSRAQELKAEAKAAELEDLYAAYYRAHNKGQKRRLGKEIKKRTGEVPA